MYPPQGIYHRSLGRLKWSYDKKSEYLAYMCQAARDMTNG